MANKLKIYLIDTETTGLNSQSHEITQISIIRYDDRTIIDRYIKPQFPWKASPEALVATGRTRADLYKGEDKKIVVAAIDKFLAEDGLTPEHRLMVAHQASFDQRFCHALWGSLNKKFFATLWLDTKPLAKQWAKDLGLIKPKLTLEASLKFADVKPVSNTWHNSASDAKNLYAFFKKAIEEEIDYLQLIKRIPHYLPNE